MPDEPNFNAVFSAQPSRGRIATALFGRARPMTGTVSASMKIEVPGLKEFRSELQGIRALLQGMRTDMERLGYQAGGFGRQMQSAATTMRSGGAQGAIGGGGGSMMAYSQPNPGGSPGGGWGMANRVMAGMPGGFGPGWNFGTSMARMAGLGGVAMGGVAAGAALIGGAAVFGADRFTETRDIGLQINQTAGRLALANRQQITGVYGTMAGNPILGTPQERYGAVNTLMNVGLGAGQQGAIASQDIKNLQVLLPSTPADQIAQAYAGYFGNVQGRKFAQMTMGFTPYTRGGVQKPIFQQFNEVLRMMEKGAGKKFSVEDLNLQQQPGSQLTSQLANIGWGPELTTSFFEYARGKAAWDAKGQGGAFEATEKQMETLRGPSQALERATSVTAEAQMNEKLISTIDDAFRQQEDLNKALTKAIEHFDRTMEDVIRAAGNLPAGGEKAAATIGAVGVTVNKGLYGMYTGTDVLGIEKTEEEHAPGWFKNRPWWLGGDKSKAPDWAKWLTGDPGGSTSHLTPDLRSRVDALLGANPGLRINSAYRSTVDQAKLYATGNPNAARPGKSKHAHGRAVDIGGSDQAMAWMQQHAAKFGLETASRFGEPWHIQLAGSTFVGDAQADRERETFLRNVSLQWIMTAKASGSGTATGAGGTGASSVTPSGETGALTVEQMLQYAYNAGFRGDDLITAVSIANRESSWNTGAKNMDVGTGDNSYGLWQINMLGSMGEKRLQQFGISSARDLLDPAVNAAAAFSLYQQSGNQFTPWGGYKGMANTYNVNPGVFDQARSAAKALGYIGDVGVGGIVGGAGITFHNNFQINVGGGGGGTSAPGLEDSLKRAAMKMEAQVRRAVSRRS